MIRSIALVAVASGLLFLGCVPEYGPRSAAYCSGGQRLVGGQCVCALGMAWNGRFCQGEPLAGGCRNGRVQFGNACACPDGTTLDGWDKCVALQCASRNAVVSGNECTCAAGTEWSEQQGRCVESTCSGGAVVSGSDCVCPGGETWSEGRCSPPEPEPTERSVSIERGHRNRRGREHVRDTSSCNAYGCWERGGGCSAYGCWKNHGGCNAYGCWQAPGACTAYGCSNRGECNAYGCP